MPGFLADILTQPRNSGYLLSVQTAMKMSLPPTVFIYDDRQPDKWTREDKKLAMAATLLERETCQYCGLPLWVCRSDNNFLGFKIRTDMCHADRELNSKANAKKAENLKPGEHQYIVPYMMNDEPLPSRAEYVRGIREDED
jgi:hypothetical protein